MRRFSTKLSAALTCLREDDGLESLRIEHEGRPGRSGHYAYIDDKEVGRAAIAQDATALARRAFPDQMPPNASAYRIQSIFVDDVYQGRGIGKKLYLAILDWYGPGTRLFNSNTEPDAVATLGSLARRGLIELQWRGGMHIMWRTGTEPTGNKVRYETNLSGMRGRFDGDAVKLSDDPADLRKFVKATGAGSSGYAGIFDIDVKVGDSSYTLMLHSSPNKEIETTEPGVFLARSDFGVDKFLEILRSLGMTIE